MSIWCPAASKGFILSKEATARGGGSETVEGLLWYLAAIPTPRCDDCKLWTYFATNARVDVNANAARGESGNKSLASCRHLLILGRLGKVQQVADADERVQPVDQPSSSPRGVRSSPLGPAMRQSSRKFLAANGTNSLLLD